MSKMSKNKCSIKELPIRSWVVETPELGAGIFDMNVMNDDAVGYVESNFDETVDGQYHDLATNSLPNLGEISGVIMHVNIADAVLALAKVYKSWDQDDIDEPGIGIAVMDEDNILKEERDAAEAAGRSVCLKIDIHEE